MVTLIPALIPSLLMWTGSLTMALFLRREYETKVLRLIPSKYDCKLERRKHEPSKYHSRGLIATFLFVRAAQTVVFPPHP